MSRFTHCRPRIAPVSPADRRVLCVARRIWHGHGPPAGLLDSM